MNSQQLIYFLAGGLATMGTMNCATTKTKTASYPDVFTPETILPAGEDFTLSTNPYTGDSGRARKGIIAATLNNVVLLNKLLSASNSDDGKIFAIAHAVKELIPSLRVVGIFDLFKVDEWLHTNDQPGRIMAAALYLQVYPQKIAASIKNLLETIMSSAVHPILQEEIKRTLQGLG